MSKINDDKTKHSKVFATASAPILLAATNEKPDEAGEANSTKGNDKLAPKMSEEEGNENEMKNPVKSSKSSENFQCIPAGLSKMCKTNDTPMVGIAPSGLLSVLLRCGVAVEMTLDGGVRVVSHQHRLAVSFSQRGRIAGVHAWGTSALVEGATLTLHSNAHQNVMLASDQLYLRQVFACWMLGPSGLVPIEPQSLDHTVGDMTVQILTGSQNSLEYASDEVIAKLQREVDENMKFTRGADGAIGVSINDVYISQGPLGKISARRDDCCITICSETASSTITTPDVVIRSYADATINATRGRFLLSASHMTLRISDGEHEAFSDTSGRVLWRSLAGDKESSHLKY